MARKSSQLKRTLKLIDVLMFGIGGIVGAGIYAIIGEAAGMAGNMLWISFGLAALVALLTGLSYAEFVSQFPDAGGSFEYVKQGFGQRAALFLSIIMLLTSVVSPAAIAISFSEYLSRLVAIPHWISTLSIVALMGLINIVGVQQSSWFNSLATIITLLGLGAVVAFAWPKWGSADLLEVPEAGFGGILSGAALIFFSYVGFEDLVKEAEETREPEKNLPRGILISGVIVLFIYLLIAISAINVMSADKLADSAGPLAAVMETVAGPGWVTGLIIVALFATSKTILTNIMGSSRLVYDVARDSEIVWMRRLTRVTDSTGTPVFAILAISILVMLFSLIGNLAIVASISNIFVFLLFLIVNSALLRYRKTHKKKERCPISYSTQYK